MIGLVESFLFSILVLGHLRDHKGNTWRRELGQMYAIEVTLPEKLKKNFKMSAACQLLNLFPSTHCTSPKDKSPFKCFDDWNGKIETLYTRLHHNISYNYAFSRRKRVCWSRH